jgi:hypothetical protein
MDQFLPAPEIGGLFELLRKLEKIFEIKDTRVNNTAIN